MGRDEPVVINRRLHERGKGLAFGGGERVLKRNANQRKRRGLSLMEVMWSMGIVAIGLLGVLILLPVAGQKVTQGTTIDAADRVGRNAVEKFQIFGMNRADRWVYFDAGANVTRVVQTPRTDAGSGRSSSYPHLPTYPLVPNFRSIPAVQNRMSFCLDPFGVLAGAQVFPYVGAGNPEMLRISLLPTPGMPDSTTNPNVDPYWPGISALMTREQAIATFVSDHDLDFVLPDEEGMPAQQFGSTASKRLSGGVFSWFATLTPKIGLPADYYVLSIVVCQRRDLSAAASYMAAQPEGEPDNERVVSATFYAAAAGFTTSQAGGDVLLETLPGRPVDDLVVSEGNWIMLAGQYPYGTLAGQFMFKWYKVTGVEGDPQLIASGYQRDVSLQGPDWEISQQPTYAVLVNDVVAVYEKTIRIKSSMSYEY